MMKPLKIVIAELKNEACEIRKLAKEMGEALESVHDVLDAIDLIELTEEDVIALENLVRAQRGEA